MRACLLQHDAAKKAAVASAVEDIHMLMNQQRLQPKTPPNWAAMPADSYNNMAPPAQFSGPQGVYHSPITVSEDRTQ